MTTPTTVKLRATHEYLKWPDGDDDDPEPLRVSAWCDPLSPIVHWSIPRTDDDFHDHELTSWDDVIEVELPLVPAARLIANWPGGVWDWREGEYDTIDYTHGVSHVSTLFVDGPTEVFEIATRMEAWRQR